MLYGTTNRDVTCSGYSPLQPGSFDRILMDSKIVKQAQNGRASVSGTTWTYAPKRGFTGPDTFTVERNMIKDNQLVVYYLQIHLEVKP